MTTDTAPDAGHAAEPVTDGEVMVPIDWATARLLASICREHGYPGTAMYLDDATDEAIDRANTASARTGGETDE